MSEHEPLEVRRPGMARMAGVAEMGEEARQEGCPPNAQYQSIPGPADLTEAGPGEG